tara:strand:+ start:414 stop:674 length:261 start_codon:yes stop_codon:yes gene_type:complete
MPLIISANVLNLSRVMIDSKTTSFPMLTWATVAIITEAAVVIAGALASTNEIYGDEMYESKWKFRADLLSGKALWGYLYFRRRRMP